MQVCVSGVCTEFDPKRPLVPTYGSLGRSEEDGDTNESDASDNSSDTDSDSDSDSDGETEEETVEDNEIDTTGGNEKTPKIGRPDANDEDDDDDDDEKKLIVMLVVIVMQQVERMLAATRTRKVMEIRARTSNWWTVGRHGTTRSSTGYSTHLSSSTHHFTSSVLDEKLSVRIKNLFIRVVRVRQAFREVSE